MTKTLTFKHPDNEPHAYGWAEAPKYKDRRQLPGSISFPRSWWSGWAAGGCLMGSLLLLIMGYGWHCPRLLRVFYW